MWCDGNARGEARRWSLARRAVTYGALAIEVARVGDGVGVRAGGGEVGEDGDGAPASARRGARGKRRASEVHARRSHRQKQNVQGSSRSVRAC